MSDGFSKAVAWLAVLAVLFVVFMWARSCQEGDKAACRERGGKVVEIEGEMLKWMCIDGDKETR